MPFSYQFPNPRTAEPDGLLAVGGDLSVESLITAYSQGIFPWYNDHSPILWWSPNPRPVLFPKDFKISNSLRQVIRKESFIVKTDFDFASVISHCASVARNGQQGTWITDEMKEAYISLHNSGYAHSFETYYEGKLVGGLYGVSIGRAFFGESMFHLKRDTSKIAFHSLVEWSLKNNFHFIDAQQTSSHILSLGAVEVDRNRFLQLLKEALKYPTLGGKWSLD